MNSTIINWRALSHLLFCFLVITGMVSCKKEGSFEVGVPGGGISGGTAVFVLVPSGTNCSDAIVSGLFEAGTKLTTDSKITVTVNVTQVGTWSYTTGTANGIAFSGAGVFTTTGSQAIVLNGTGTPSKAGDYTYKLNIGGANCSIIVSVFAAGTGGTGTAEYYYKATIGGISYTQIVTDNNNYEAGSGKGGLDDVSFSSGIYYSNPPTPAGFTEMEVNKGIMHNYLAATPIQFKAFFAPGIYPFAQFAINEDGIDISWRDPSGDVWSTRNGALDDQVGSSFKIISAVDTPDALGRTYLKVKMQFNCKLYNSSGAMKELKNGEMVGDFGML